MKTPQRAGRSTRSVIVIAIIATFLLSQLTAMAYIAIDEQARKAVTRIQH